MKRLVVLACVLVAVAACNTTQTSGVPAPRKPPPVLVGPDPLPPVIVVRQQTDYTPLPRVAVSCNRVGQSVMCF